MRKRWGLFLAVASVLAMLLIAAACGEEEEAPSPTPTPTATETATPTPTPTPRPIQKATMLVGTQVPNPALAPQTSIPQALGYWEEEGLDVTVRTGVQGDAQAVQLLVAGEGTTAVVSPSTLMSAREQGLDLVAVYVYVRGPLNSIFVLDESPIQAISELAGRTIGSYSPAGGPIDEGKFILSQSGVDPASVNFLDIGFSPATAEAIRNGQVDAYIVTEPDFFTTLGLNLRKLPDPTEANRFGFVYAFTRDTIENHPDIVIGMLRGIAKATLFAVTNPEAAIQAHWQVFPESKPTGMSEEEALASAVVLVSGRYAKYKKASGEQWGTLPNLAARWRVMQQLALQAGTITQEVDVAEYFTEEFIDEINDFDEQEVINDAQTFQP